MSLPLGLEIFCRQYFPESTHLELVNLALVVVAQKLFGHVMQRLPVL